MARRTAGLGPVLALALTGSFAGGAAVNLIAKEGAPAPAVAQPIPVDSMPLNRLSLAPLVERVAPAVVNIAVLQSSPYAQIRCCAILITAISSASRTRRWRRASRQARASWWMPRGVWW